MNVLLSIPKFVMDKPALRTPVSHVHLILRMMANGDTFEDILEEYPSLTREDIHACFDYGSE